MKTTPEVQPRVLLLTPDTNSLGGVANYYSTLGLTPEADGVEYFVITTAGRESAIQRFLRLLKNYSHFWHKLSSRECYPLVVLNPSLNANSYYRDALFCWLAQLRHRQILVFFRGWSDDFEQAVRSRAIPSTVLLLTYGRVRNFVVLGSTFRQRLIGLGCSPESRFWIESTVADDSYLPEFSIERRMSESRPMRILFMSRLVPSKGPMVAIQAFDLAQRRLPQASLELVVAGDGPESNALQDFVQAEAIPNVRFVGSVSGTAKKEVLLGSDMFIFPTSYGEGMPNVVLEAMLYGMPVLARDIGAIRDAVEHQKNGFLTTRTDPHLFADWIVLLATDRALYRHMALANHLKALQLYTAATVRSRLKSIFAEIMT